MRRVAVFGNAGGGKSTLARQLAEITRLPLYIVDKLQFREGGDPVPHEEFLRTHAEILSREAWIIDGFGGRDVAWQRFAAADTLVYVDLPLALHGWWVTKRLLKGLLADPEGWPASSPLWSSTLSSYRVLWPCHRHLTPRYRQLVAGSASSKHVHHLTSPAQIGEFLQAAKKKGPLQRALP